jgi:hypothetical protein
MLTFRLWKGNQSFHLYQKYHTICLWLLARVLLEPSEVAHGLKSKDVAQIMTDWVSYPAALQMRSNG